MLSNLIFRDGFSKHFTKNRVLVEQIQKTILLLNRGESLVLEVDCSHDIYNQPIFRSFVELYYLKGGSEISG
jgi:hypothetical protein